MEETLGFTDNEENQIFLSMASIWEMQIKVDLGRLEFNLTIGEKVAKQRKNNGLSVLSITEAHIYDLPKLANHHRDPFDRLLVAQARVENMTIITADQQVHAYDVKTLW